MENNMATWRNVLCEGILELLNSKLHNTRT